MDEQGLSVKQAFTYRVHVHRGISLLNKRVQARFLPIPPRADACLIITASGSHVYKALQIAPVNLNFVFTMTMAAPAFPLMIVALVPGRLLLMNRTKNGGTLRFVGAWGLSVSLCYLQKIKSMLKAPGEGCREDNREEGQDPQNM